MVVNAINLWRQTYKMLSSCSKIFCQHSLYEVNRQQEDIGNTITNNIHNPLKVIFALAARGLRS